jgi:hypothetical protein
MSMNASNAMSTPTSSRLWLIRLAVPLILLAAVVGWMAYRAAIPPQAAAPDGAVTMPANPEIEARLGVRFTQVGITADGGMVDLRYLVLDPDKAMALMSMSMAEADTNPTAPKMIIEQNGTEIANSEVMSMKQLPEANSVQFILYANPRGLLKPGMLVTIVVGDLRLTHVPVQ